MNKQELIEKYKTKYAEEPKDWRLPSVNASRQALFANFINDLGQLDEPKKVVVPKFVADFIEDGNDYDKIAFLVHQKFLGVNSLMRECPVKKWLMSVDYETVLSLVNSYEVEKEQLYYVKLPLTEWNDDTSELETKYVYLTEDITSEEIRLQASNSEHGDWKVKLTEERVKSIDERYWLFAVKVEV